MPPLRASPTFARFSQVDGVVLFVQGQPSDLRAYTSSKYSEVARRYTNLFAAPDMLADPSGAFLERRLIHRTARGELVRSISEVVVADALSAEGIDYHYEKALCGADGVARFPDFTAEDPSTGVTIYWEHLGMLSDPTYASRWEKKLNWYKDVLGLEPNGAENDQGERLVTSENRLDGAIDSAKIRQQVRDVFDRKRRLSPTFSPVVCSATAPLSQDRECVSQCLLRLRFSDRSGWRFMHPDIGAGRMR